MRPIIYATHDQALPKPLRFGDITSTRDTAAAAMRGLIAAGAVSAALAPPVRRNTRAARNSYYTKLRANGVKV